MCQPYHEVWIFVHEHNSYRILISLLKLCLINVFEVKHLGEVGEHYLKVGIGKSFSKAYSFTTAER